jgi:putative resolvase
MVMYRYSMIIYSNEVADDEKDLMQDFVSLVTSFTARLYGRRRSRRKTEELINQLAKEDDHS